MITFRLARRDSDGFGLSMPDVMLFGVNLFVLSEILRTLECLSTRLERRLAKSKPTPSTEEGITDWAGMGLERSMD